MNIRHIACLSAIVASIALAGCNNADEAKARNDCDKTGAAKTATCAVPAKQKTETGLAGIAKALNK